TETQARRAEPGAVGLARLDHQPVEAAFAAGLLDDVVAVEAARVDQRRQRAALLGVALGAAGGLLEVGVVDPHALTVGDDQLLVRLPVFPAEQARRGQRDRPARGLPELAVG